MKYGMIASYWWGISRALVPPIIPRYQRKKETRLVPKVKNAFIGVHKPTKNYHLYDELNNKFILYKDVFFLEMNKNDDSIER